MNDISPTRSFLIVCGMFLAGLAVVSGCPATRRADVADVSNAKAGDADGVETPRAKVAANGASGSNVDGQTSPDEHPQDENPGRAAPGEATPGRTSPGDADAGNDRPQKFDPLFVGWPRPRAALVISGRQHGYFEPCGCTGLAHQKGGLSRRHTLLKQLAEKGWPPVALDLGDQVRRFGKQPEIKFNTTVEGLKKMGYAAVAYGPDDLRLSGTELLMAAVGTDGVEAPFVAANVSVLGQTKPYRVIEAGGEKIGITAILGAAEQEKVQNDDVEITPAAEGLEKVLPKLKARRCDLLVLLAHASAEESRRLARRFPDFRIVVTAGGAGEPKMEPDRIEPGGAWLVQVGAKGMYVGVIGLFDDSGKPMRYQRVPLDARFGDSREMIDLLASYQQQLEALGLEGLELAAPPHPSGRKFVGSDICGDCHTVAFEIWEKTPHAHALDTLVRPPERYEVPRHHDPECLACHVVGWQPHRYHPYKSGYRSIESTPQLRQVGCENCHGPGSAHAAAENGDIDATDAEIETFRKEVRLPLKEARQTCLKCHDLDNSINFHKEGAFEEYWKKVEHKGTE